MEESLSADAKSFDWIDLCGCDFYCFSVKLHADCVNQLISERTECSRSVERGTHTDRIRIVGVSVTPAWLLHLLLSEKQ